jgi:hypothetical protein
MLPHHLPQLLRRQLNLLHHLIEMFRDLLHQYHHHPHLQQQKNKMSRLLQRY